MDRISIKFIHKLTFPPIPNVHTECIIQPTQNLSSSWIYTHQNPNILLQFILSCHVIRPYTGPAQDETLVYKNPCLATCSALQQRCSEQQFDGHSLEIICSLLPTAYRNINSRTWRKKKESPYLIPVTSTCVPDLLDEVKY